MITSSRPYGQVLFAGRQQHSKNPIKAGLIGLLLGSAGGAAAISKQVVSPSSSAMSGDSFSQSSRPVLKNAPHSAKWDEIILAQNPKTLKAKHNRKLLQQSALPPLPAESPEDQAAREILQEPPFAPTDINLFTTSYYPEASPAEPAELVPQTDEMFTQALEEVFNNRFQGDTQKIQEGLAVFNDPVLKTKIPTSRLRAAVAAMKGTASEGAIDYFKSDAFGTMKFNVHRDPERNIANMVLPKGETQFELWVNPRYYGEDFRILPMFIAYEATHQDLDNFDQVNAEPLIGFAAASLEYLKMLTLFPQLAQSGSELSRRANELILSRLNTRDEHGHLRLFTNVGVTVPGSVEPYYQSVGDLFDITDPSQAATTPGNAFLKSLLKNITCKEVENPDFSPETLKLFDENQNYLSPSELVKAGQALKLNMTGVDDTWRWDELMAAEAPAPASNAAPSPDTTLRKLSRRLMKALGQE